MYTYGIYLALSTKPWLLQIWRKRDSNTQPLQSVRASAQTV